MSCDFYVALPHGAMGWSAVCDCGILWSEEWDRGYHTISRTLNICYVEY